MRSALLVLVAFVAACSTPAQDAPWQARLHGDTIVLLGEVHDNAAQHRLRLQILERAFAAGWRPSIVMEQFDRDRQGDIDRARRERPVDAQHVIDLAGGAGWNWAFYRPFVALALRYDVPLIGANLANADTTRIVRGGYEAVFDAATAHALGLDRSIDPAWEQAQESEIDAGHCHALPAALWPRMARAQFARDAVMAEALHGHARHGAVLLAGNGHARRDFGVPRWLVDDRARVWSVGFLEGADAQPLESAFDAVVRTEAAARSDPCAGFAPR